MPVTLLTEAQLRESVKLDLATVAIIEKAFTRLAEHAVTLPPIMSLDFREQHGEVDIKAAHIQGEPSFAVKIASGFFDNPRQGLSSSSGLMLVFSSLTGFLEAILLDHGYLTQVRTGAAGCIAAKYLARSEIEIAGVIGAGTQARYQVRALSLVRSFQRLMVYGIIPEENERYAQEMQDELGVQVVIAQTPEQVVRACDIVVTTTPAREPYLQPDWLHPGLHITCMGSDSPDKQELHPGVFTRADRIVCDHKAQCLRLGELHHAHDSGLVSQFDEIWELGDLTSGRIPGRQDTDEISICDLTGVGVQDAAIALHAYHNALAVGVGLEIS